MTPEETNPAKPAADVPTDHSIPKQELALLGRVSGEPFTTAHRRFMSHIVRKVEYVIEKSFDAMTGLMNRSGFEAQLHETWKGLESDDDAHQIIYFDLDNLQLVNDTFGRKAGDEVIMQFARLLDQDLPRSAVLSRLTGDDFRILLVAGYQVLLLPELAGIVAEEVARIFFPRTLQLRQAFADR